MQWFRSTPQFEPFSYEVLIRGSQAYLKGVFRDAVLGSTGERRQVEAVLGDRWLRCDAAGYLRKGHDHSALGRLAKHVRPDHAEPEMHHLLYDDGPLSPPVPEEERTIDLVDALARLADARRVTAPPRPARQRARLTVHVSGPESPDLHWTVSSNAVVEHLAPGEGGPVAEDRVRELLALHARHSLDVLEFDSSSEEFIAYAETAEHAD